MVILPLASHHNRADFDCGEIDLNDFLQKFAGQYTRSDFGRTYVALASESDSKILGYSTIAVSSVPFENIPANLPRHPVPVLRLGRLATDLTAQGQGVGKMLLIHALKTTVQLSDLVGIHAVEVVALHETAKQFYLKYGFMPLKNDSLHLYLPVKAIRKLNL